MKEKWRDFCEIYLKRKENIQGAKLGHFDKAEEEREIAETINVRAPQEIARWCQQNDRLMIHFSTDYVFSGEGIQPWKEEDPNVPLSPWWYTSDPARMVGMRLVRSATPLSDDLMHKFWEIDVDAIQEDVDARLREGRGAIGISVPELIKEFQRKK